MVVRKEVLFGRVVGWLLRGEAQGSERKMTTIHARMTTVVPVWRDYNGPGACAVPAHCQRHVPLRAHAREPEFCPQTPKFPPNKTNLRTVQTLEGSTHIAAPWRVQAICAAAVDCADVARPGRCPNALYHGRPYGKWGGCCELSEGSR